MQGPPRGPRSVALGGAWRANALLPRARLGSTEHQLFDGAMRGLGWRPAPEYSSALTLRWHRATGEALGLQTLGWFPLLVTAGPVGRPTRAHREAISRLIELTRAEGGRVWSDRRLVDYLPEARTRWTRALTEQRRLTEAERLLLARRCGRCGRWSEFRATHCALCEHRFTPAEDAARDRAREDATSAIASAEHTLAALARGVLLSDLGSNTRGGGRV